MAIGFLALKVPKKQTFEETTSLSRDYEPVAQDNPQILLWAVSGRKWANSSVSKPLVHMSDCVLPSAWWYRKKNSSYLKLRQPTWSRVRISRRRRCCWVLLSYFIEKDLGLQVKILNTKLWPVKSSRLLHWTLNSSQRLWAHLNLYLSKLVDWIKKLWLRLFTSHLESARCAVSSIFRNQTPSHRALCLSRAVSWLLFVRCIVSLVVFQW